MYHVINSYWYTGQEFGGVIGFVAIRREHDSEEWKVYCGVGWGVDPAIDSQMIAGGGAKVTREVALAHFPDLDPDKFVY